MIQLLLVLVFDVVEWLVGCLIIDYAQGGGPEASEQGLCG